MKHLKQFTRFINEQEEKNPTPPPPSVGSGIDTTGLGDIFKDAAKIFKDAGFLPADAEGGGMTWGDRLQATGEYKVPSAEEVQKGVDAVNAAMDRHGITDKNMRASIQGVIGKESGWVPKNEHPYTNTSNDRIRKIFGKRVASLSDAELNMIKADPNKFWDRVYGPDDITGASQKMGNTNPGDGAKYLGRGFNGITGRANYKTYTDMLRKAGSNIDLISNPEILEKSPEASAEVNALYFINGLSHPLIRRKYGNSNPTDFKDFDTALKAVVNANAGAGTDITRGFAKVSYDAAIAANNKLASKFDKAVSGSSGDTSRIA